MGDFVAFSLLFYPVSSVSAGQQQTILVDFDVDISVNVEIKKTKQKKINRTPLTPYGFRRHDDLTFDPPFKSITLP